jgi:transcriptional accessory protein Tex/SPT6
LLLAKESEHPRAYEVTGQLLKTTADLTKDLIELQVTMNKIENSKDGGKPQKVVNNAILVGSTNDLLEQLKGKNREKSDE